MFDGSYGFFCAVLLVHVILLLLDNVLKWWSPSYATFQERYGIAVQLFLVKWFTTAFNRCIQKLGNWRPKFQKTWFSFGMWITLFTLPFAIYFVVQSTCVIFVKVMWKESKFDKIATTPFLEPAVPGINIPVSDLGYYASTLLICSVFHELGHAIAAVREGVRISGVGVLVLFVVPVAYVRIEGLEKLTSSKQLRIFCAGVWHNIVLALGATIVIFLLPIICYPFYEYGTGIQVVSIHKNSPLQESGGLKTSDIVYSVNDCPVYDQNTWIKCLNQAARNPIVGYCVDSEFIHSNDESVQGKT